MLLRLSFAVTLAWLAAVPALAFDLEGHRGTRGLRPENTLAAFSRAIEIGVTTLETDLAVTKDGVLVISHDPFLNPDVVRGPDGRWLAEKGPPIHSLTQAELERYDIGRLDPASKYAQQFPQQLAVDGQRFPTLAQVFALAQGSGEAGAAQPRNQDHADESRGYGRRRHVRAARRGRHSRGPDDVAHVDPVVRLAHAGGGEEARARDRDGMPYDRDAELRHGAEQVGDAFSLARRA